MTALVAALSVVPLFERLKPILRALPEVDEQKTHPGELSGSIEVSHVSFRYEQDGPLALDDVTFKVRAGEFVALVGPSGSGKSTLLRHLLGFETPDSGAIYYDGQALAEVDLRAVRRQIGVVLAAQQGDDAAPFWTTSWEPAILSADEAWEAARSAGIAGRHRADADGDAHLHQRGRQHALRRAAPASADRACARDAPAYRLLRRSDQRPR